MYDFATPVVSELPDPRTGRSRSTSVVWGPKGTVRIVVGR